MRNTRPMNPLQSIHSIYRYYFFLLLSIIYLIRNLASTRAEDETAIEEKWKSSSAAELCQTLSLEINSSVPLGSFESLVRRPWLLEREDRVSGISYMRSNQARALSSLAIEHDESRNCARLCSSLLTKTRELPS